MSLLVQVAAKTDIGCVRTNNEDNFAYNEALGIYTVCDGMGGQAAGEVASRMAIESFCEYFSGTVSDETSAFLKRIEDASDRANSLAAAIFRANQVVNGAALADESRRGMGSTIVAVWTDPEQRLFSIAHVGDSRIYLLRDGSLQQLTEDHSLVMQQVKMGILTPEEAERSHMQNVITRALGASATVEIDVGDEAMKDGDQLLLCTDGLTGMLSDDAIYEILTTAPKATSAVEDLIEDARGNGGEDNITCIVLRFVERPWYSRIFGKGSHGGSQWQNSF